MIDTLLDFILALCAAALFVIPCTCILCFAAGRLKELRKRDRYLLAAIVNLVWYCVAVLVLSAHDHAVPDSLTVAWFAAWTAELALLANIKIKGKDE